MLENFSLEKSSWLSRQRLKYVKEASNINTYSKTTNKKHFSIASDNTDIDFRGIGIR